MEFGISTVLAIGGSGVKLRQLLCRSDSFGITELVFVFNSKKICDLEFCVRDGEFIVNKYEKSRRKKFESIEKFNSYFLSIYNKTFIYVYHPVVKGNRFDMFQIDVNIDRKSVV